jgi:hypothetical protein
MAKEKPIAEVIHLFDKISVAILKIAKGAKIKAGDTVRFVSTKEEFEQKIGEIQLDHKAIPEAKAGMEVGVKVDQKVREGTKVYNV